MSDFCFNRKKNHALFPSINFLVLFICWQWFPYQCCSPFYSCIDSQLINYWIQINFSFCNLNDSIAFDITNFFYLDFLPYFFFSDIEFVNNLMMVCCHTKTLCPHFINKLWNAIEEHYYQVAVQDSFKAECHSNPNSWYL